MFISQFERHAYDLYRNRLLTTYKLYEKVWNYEFSMKIINIKIIFLIETKLLKVVTLIKQNKYRFIGYTVYAVG